MTKQPTESNCCKSEPFAWMVESADKRHFIFRTHEPVIGEGETITPMYTHPHPTVPDHVLVPIEFIRQFCDLAHNYSLPVVAPIYYFGTERDAYGGAFAECGRELAKLRAMLESPPNPATQYVPPPNCRQRLRAEGKAYPKSTCQSCGSLSPNWKQCDAALATDNKEYVW